MKKRVRGAFLAAALAGISGCAMFGGRGDVSLVSDSAMPAAEGSARFAPTKNDNTSVDLRVKHLARPEKLTPPASSYVVWTKATKDAEAQNIGALKVDKDLSGSLQTETPLHSFELLITAEPTGQAQEPTGRPLLWASYSR